MIDLQIDLANVNVGDVLQVNLSKRQRNCDIPIEDTIASQQRRQVVFCALTGGSSQGDDLPYLVNLHL